MPIEKYYNVEEVATLLSVNQMTILRWIKKGTLKAKKVGQRYLIKESNLKDLLD
jgi:excisionase family DNA binding protein